MYLIRIQIPVLVALLTITGGTSYPQAFATDNKIENSNSKLRAALDNPAEIEKLNQKINSLYKYRDEKNFTAFNELSQEFLLAFRGLESQVTSLQQANVAITLLKGVASAHCAVRPRWAKAESASPENFDIANALELRALALVDKYQPNIHARVNAHYEMLFWYKALKKDREAAMQSRVLSKLLNTNDPSKINPSPPSCHGCGMG